MGEWKTSVGISPAEDCRRGQLWPCHLFMYLSPLLQASLPSTLLNIICCLSGVSEGQGEQVVFPSLHTAGSSPHPYTPTMRLL